MRRTVSALLTVLAAACFAAGETMRLEITADNGICAYREEKVLNTGGRSRVRIKGNDHYLLIDFSAEPVRTWRIEKATLHLRLVRGNIRRMAACTVPIRWPEGTGSGEPQRGASCYTHVRYPDVPWTPGGGTLLEATFNNPRMLWRPAKVERSGDWLQVDLAPELIYAVAHGLSHGLALAEEAGQSRENHDVFTREQSSSRPYIVVKGTPAKPAPLAKRPSFRAEPFAAGASFEKGAVRVVIDRPAGKGIFGHRVRLTRSGSPVRDVVTLGSSEVVVGGLRPGEEYGVRLTSYAGRDAYWSAAQTVRSSPAQTVPKVSAASAAARGPLDSAAANGWRVDLHAATALVAASAKPGPAAATPAPIAPRGAWAAVSAAIHPPGGKAKNVRVSVAPFAPAGGSSRPAELKPVRLYRTWYVAGRSAHHAEVCVPILPDAPAAGIDIPWAANKVAGQANQQLFIEVWVPKEAAPGRYASKLIVRHDGREVVSVALSVEVSPVELAGAFGVVGSMNAYNTPARALGAQPSELGAFLAAERAYYRLAHAHRMTLNVLPYSQSGSIHWGGAPTLAGRGAECRIADWTLWDRRYGPLLSGEAFSAAQGYVGPGDRTPIDHMYLSFHENWPAKLADHFRPWPPPKDYNRLLRWLADLPPVEQCLDDAYREAWSAVLKQFHDHLRRKGWTRTRYQVYPNNKYYFRRKGRGVSLWLLDEPMFADDFRALAYFGRRVRAFRRAAGAPSASVIRYRIDISRPTHQRTWLDGLVDLNVCADQLYAQRRQIASRKRRFGEAYWNYAMPGSFGRDNVGWACWPVRSYLWGAVGTLPWQTIGSDGDFAKADATALMYPGTRFGLKRPLASLRMKAWRDGLQDAELLRMLRRRRKWTHVQLRAWAGQVVGLDGWPKAMDPAGDAGIVTFRGLTSAKLHALRRAALSALSQGQP